LIQFWKATRDILFRIGLYRGVRLACPPDLCSCSMAKEGELSRLYRCDINAGHPLATWLLFECEGAWGIGMYHPRRNRKIYVAFARSADAMIFRLMQN
jgi:hypothetical protein